MGCFGRHSYHDLLWARRSLYRRRHRLSPGPLRVEMETLKRVNDKTVSWDLARRLGMVNGWQSVHSDAGSALGCALERGMDRFVLKPRSGTAARAARPT